MYIDNFHSTNCGLYTNKIAQALGRIENDAIQMCQKSLNFLGKDIIFVTKIRPALMKRLKSLKGTISSENQKIVQHEYKNEQLKNRSWEKQHLAFETEISTHELEAKKLLDSSDVIKKELRGIKFKIAKFAMKIIFCITPLIILIVIPCAVVGFLLRAVLSPWKEELVMQSPEKNLPTSSIPPKTFKIATANVAIAEVDLMNSLNNVNSSELRAEELADFFINLNADVLCLQEAFCNKLVIDIIVKKLKEQGFHVVYAAKPKWIGYSSGNLIASRFPFKKVGFKEYQHLEGPDQFARKGVLAATVALSPGKEIIVANTHFNGGFNGDTAEKIEKRLNMMKEAQLAIDCFKKYTGVEETLFLGDINTSRFATRQLFDAKGNAKTWACVEYDSDPIVFLTAQQGWKELTNSINFSNSKKESKVPFHKNKQNLYSQQNLNEGALVERWGPENNETGQSVGTCFDEHSLGYHYFLDLIYLETKREITTLTDYQQENLEDIIKHVISELYLGKVDHNLTLLPEQKTQLIKIIEKYKDRGRKVECLDHIFISKGRDQYFNETNYEYASQSPIGPSGLLSDHAVVSVTLQAK